MMSGGFGVALRNFFADGIPPCVRGNGIMSLLLFTECKRVGTGPRYPRLVSMMSFVTANAVPPLARPSTFVFEPKWFIDHHPKTAAFRLY